MLRNLFDQPALLLLGSLLVLALFVAALLDVLRRPGVAGPARLAWVVVIVLLPLLGSLLWFALRDRDRGAADPG